MVILVRVVEGMQCEQVVRVAVPQEVVVRVQ